MWFENIPSINEFITRQTWRHLGKILRTKNDCLPKKMLGAWVPTACKSRSPQTHLKENFIQALKSVLKENISDYTMFKADWLPMAKDEEKWNATIDTHFENLSNKNKISHASSTNLLTDMICKKKKKPKIMILCECAKL